MPQLEALITPAVMKWARIQAGYDIPTAASKLDRPEQDIQGWEDGTILPSMAQARKASEVYKRSLAVFYLPEPPKDFATLRDFRTLPSDKPRAYSPELALLIRNIQMRQQWLRDWSEQENAKQLTFVGSARSDWKAGDVAAAIRKTLNITTAEQIGAHDRREALNLWIERAEAVGVYICRQGGIDCEEARGIVLTDNLAPFIFLNSNDALVAQLFTLVHELAHLWINQPGLSNLEGLGRSGTSDTAKIEIFCNQVAADALIDPPVFASLWKASDDQRSLEERIEQVAGKMKVSEEAIARRLLDSAVITVQRYQELRKQYMERWRAFKEEERRKSKLSPGGPSPHLLRVLANGRSFTTTVLSAYYGGTISGRDASGLLGVKINNLPKVAEYAGASFRSK